MNALWTHLDSLPLGPVAMFALGYLAFLVTVLSLFKRRHADECPRCGGLWELTDRGNEIHFCRDRHREHDQEKA
jgi:hypothetical protein